MPKHYPPLIRQIDPDADEAAVDQLLGQLADFVKGGPYFHENNNVCWFCYQGIAWEQEGEGEDDGTHQLDAGHHATCSYLAAYIIFWGVAKRAD